jgi:hypothetical protein
MEHSAVSIGQSGGITAHTIHLACYCARCVALPPNSSIVWRSCAVL